MLIVILNFYAHP